MRIGFSVLILVAALLVSTGQCFGTYYGQYVGAANYSGSRVTPFIVGDGSWGAPDVNIRLDWVISEPGSPGSDWLYKYTITIIGPSAGQGSGFPGLSHMTLEVTPDVFSLNGLSLLSGNPGEEDWGIEHETAYFDGSQGNSSPDWPDGITMYGTKFDFEEGEEESVNAVTGKKEKMTMFSFYSPQSPVWGTGYFKGGREGAYTSSLPYLSDPVQLNALEVDHFIARPDGVEFPEPNQEVPIPGAVWLLSSGLIGLVSLRLR